MSDKNALVPIEQETFEFYDDEIVAVRVKEGTVYVPVRPICELLGMDWSGQRQRIMRDPVLSQVTMSVGVITANSRHGAVTRDTSFGALNGAWNLKLIGQLAQDGW